FSRQNAEKHKPGCRLDNIADTRNPANFPANFRIRGITHLTNHRYTPSESRLLRSVGRSSQERHARPETGRKGGPGEPRSAKPYFFDVFRPVGDDRDHWSNTAFWTICFLRHQTMRAAL